MNQKNGMIGYKFFLCCLLLLSIILTGCNSHVIEVTEKEKHVKVKRITEENYPLLIEYYGRLEPKILKNYAFKLGGKLKIMNVKIGDAVESGALLAMLDSFDVDLGLEASLDQLRMAELDVEKAEKAYAFYLDLYNKMLALYNIDGISTQQFNEVKLQKDTTEKELEQAQKRKQQAEIEMSYKAKTVEDSSLVSDIGGYIADVYYEEGELVPLGYPVMTIRSYKQIAKTSITLEDVKKIKIGDKANVIIEEISYDAVIAHINLVPNQGTKTYGVEIDLDTDVAFVLGQDCHIEIQEKTQNRTGIWLSISEIMNDGADYVYVVKENRAFRKNIETHEIYKDKVRVTGLDVNDQVIIEGITALTEGVKVIVEGEVNE